MKELNIIKEKNEMIKSFFLFLFLLILLSWEIKYFVIITNKE